MAYQARNNSGSLWVNDRKTEDKHPDRTGTLIVDGVEYFIDGWIKKTSAGKQFLSLSVKRKNKQSASQHEEHQQQPQPRKSAPPQRTPPPSDPDLDAPIDGEYAF